MDKDKILESLEVLKDVLRTTEKSLNDITYRIKYGERNLDKEEFTSDAFIPCDARLPREWVDNTMFNNKAVIIFSPSAVNLYFRDCYYPVEGYCVESGGVQLAILKINEDGYMTFKTKDGKDFFENNKYKHWFRFKFLKGNF